MDENLKQELDHIVHSASRKRLERWVIMLLIASCVLASAGGIHWLTDRTNSQEEVKEMMQDGFIKIDKRFDKVEYTIQKNQSEQDQFNSDQKQFNSEQKQFNKIVKNELTQHGKIQAEQIEEIYNQMKRDQSPSDKRDSEAESYAPINPIKRELQSFASVPDFKKKLNQ